MRAQHTITAHGKHHVLSGSKSKIEIGLFRLDQEYPDWIWEDLTLNRLFDIVDEVNWGGYERKSLGKLKLDKTWREPIVVNPSKMEARWGVVEEVGLKIDGAFFVRKQDQTLLSVDLFQRILYTEGGRGITYEINTLYVLR